MLQIEPTKDKKRIKKALAMQSKIIHPEEQKEAFLKLQQAYQEAIAYAQDETIDSYEDTDTNTIVYHEKPLKQDELFHDVELIDEAKAAFTYVNQQLSHLPKKINYEHFVQLFHHPLFKHQLRNAEACEIVDQSIVKKKWILKKQEAIQLEKLLSSYPLTFTKKKLNKLTKKDRLGNIITIILSTCFVAGMNLYFILDDEEVKPVPSAPNALIEALYDGIQIKDHHIYDKNDQIIVSDYDAYELGRNALLYLANGECVLYETDTSKKILLDDIQEAHFVSTADDSQYYVAFLRDDRWYLISQYDQKPSVIENEYRKNPMIESKDQKLYFKDKE